MERASSLCLSPRREDRRHLRDGACGLALRALAVPLLRAEAAVAVDGANRFDPYEISRAARARGETAGRPCRASTSPGRSPATRWKRSCPVGCPRRSPGSTPGSPSSSAFPRRSPTPTCRTRRRAAFSELPLRAARARPRGDAGRPRRERGTAGFGGPYAVGPLPADRAGSSATSSERPIPSFSCDGPRAA